MPLIGANGVLDVYQPSDFDYDVVLKPSLIVAKKEETRITYAWKIPLGPDAAIAGGRATASSLTYGGDKIELSAESGSLADYSGNPIFLDKSIIVGELTAEVSSDVGSQELWLSLKLDEKKGIVEGEFTDMPDSQHPDDGIIPRDVFFAKNSSFAPDFEANVGSKVSTSLIQYGAFGTLQMPTA
ncbi:hypothetical protein, partial [Fibrobacter sp.]|uniref:hypothetical protein n=1 Tax=Fibrobacter sp. TaxID=35828 RepID=UPI00389038D9